MMIFAARLAILLAMGVAFHSALAFWERRVWL